MKKKIIILSTVLVILAAVLVVALLCFKLVDTIKYSSFYDIAENEFYIPDLMDGYVPQGFEYMEKERVFLSCGYMSDEEEASRVYVINDHGEYYYTELTAVDVNKPYTGHTGGVSYYGEYVYITGDTGIDVFSLEDILDEEKEYTPLLGSIDTSAYGVNPAFCFVYDDKLYTGEFYLAGEYETPKEHHIDIDGRDENKAIMLSFTLHERFNNVENSCYYIGGKKGDNGVVTGAAPSAVYSIPDKVQGICMIGDDKLAISTSYGMDDSIISVHELEEIKDSTYNSSNVGIDKSVPLYIIDSNTEVDSLVAPPMAEEIVFVDGRIWIMNESASNEYIFGKFTTGNNLYSVEYPFPVED